MLLKRDCVEVMNQLEEESVDIILADPPYGINFQSSMRSKGERLVKIANDETPFTDWIQPAYRILKNGGCGICFYRWDVQDAFLHGLKEAGFDVRSQIVWDKIGHGMGDLKSQFSPQHELMIFFVKGKYHFPGGRPKSIYQVPKITGTNLSHPNEKPRVLIGKILNDISRDMDKVFIPFAGSGADIEACIDRKLEWVATEISDEYFVKCEKRIKNYQSQYSLF